MCRSGACKVSILLVLRFFWGAVQQNKLAKEALWKRTAGLTLITTPYL